MWDMPMMKCTKSRDSNELCEWDQALLPPRVITNVLNNITSQGSTESCVLVCTILPFEIERVFKAIEESMFNDAHIFTWYKNNMNVEGYNNYVFATELMVVAYYPKRKDVHWNVPGNPLLRHNHLEWPKVKRYELDEAGEPVNLSQKPIAVTSYFVQRHLDPSHWGLSLGGGTGTDPLAFGFGGRSGICLENDPRQFQASVQRFNKNLARHRQLFPDIVDHIVPINDVGTTFNLGLNPPISTVEWKAMMEGKMSLYEDEQSVEQKQVEARCMLCGKAFDGEEMTSECVLRKLTFHTACCLQDQDEGVVCSDVCRDDHDLQQKQNAEDAERAAQDDADQEIDPKSGENGAENHDYGPENGEVLEQNDSNA